MMANGFYISEDEVLRQAERERARVIAEFVRKLFAPRKHGAPAHGVPAE